MLRFSRVLLQCLSVRVASECLPDAIPAVEWLGLMAWSGCPLLGLPVAFYPEAKALGGSGRLVSSSWGLGEWLGGGRSHRQDCEGPG